VIEKKYCPYCAHLLVKKHIDGRTRFYCENCDTVIYKNPLPATASVIINNNKILLVKRKFDPCRGEWSLPGGFIEIDEDPEAACLRELKEETGLNAEIDRIIDAYHSKSEIYDSVIVIGYLIKNITGNLVAGDDAEEAAYFDIKTLPSIAFKSHKMIIGKALNI
jgi:8-oxo-dGTP diphosphatase